MENQFAKMLKYYLMLNDKTQTDLANDLGYEKSTVSNWVNGARVPKVDVLIEISRYLHVNVGDLVEDKRDEQNYYLDDETKEFADFIYKNPEYRVLFDASRKVKKEDIELVAQLIKKMGGE